MLLRLMVCCKVEIKKCVFCWMATPPRFVHRRCCGASSGRGLDSCSRAKHRNLLQNRGCVFLRCLKSTKSTREQNQSPKPGDRIIIRQTCRPNNNCTVPLAWFCFLLSRPFGSCCRSVLLSSNLRGFRDSILPVLAFHGIMRSGRAALRLNFGNV